jgi:hypothetical protein
MMTHIRVMTKPDQFGVCDDVSSLQPNREKKHNCSLINISDIIKPSVKNTIIIFKINQINNLCQYV